MYISNQRNTTHIEVALLIHLNVFIYI